MKLERGDRYWFLIITVIPLAAFVVLVVVNSGIFFMERENSEVAEMKEIILMQHQEEEGEMEEKVTAQAILRRRNGSSILEATEPITSENVAKYKVDEGITQEASAKLSAYGFEIGEAGPYSLSITGEKQLFERVFRTRLTAKKSAEPGIQATFYEVEEPIKVPDELSALIADVALTRPPELFP